MILTFSNGAHGAQFVSIDGGKPLFQKQGCPTMFESARECGGRLHISDTPIEGWAGPCTWDGYFRGQIKDYGVVVSGALVERVCEAIGFSMKTKGWCWSADNRLHKCNPKQIREALELGQEQMDTYLEEKPKRPLVAEAK